MRVIGCLSAFVLFIQLPAAAQQSVSEIAVAGTWTSSSKLFHHAHDPDESLRNEYFPIDNLFSAGIDYRRSFESLRLTFGLSIEYISARSSFLIPTASGGTAPGTDGFTTVPIEASAYFTIPIGTDDFAVYMGGGGGIYPGTRYYEVAGVRGEETGNSVGAGIQVTGGVEWFFTSVLGLRGEVEFRDVQFESSTSFRTPTIIYKGESIPVSTTPVASRVNIDGTAVHLAFVMKLR